jgi:hypothetical protein
MRTQLCIARALIATVSVTAALACGSNPTGPSLAAVAGTYTATQFTTTDGGTATNQLAAGASIALTLNANGTTSGRLIVPGQLDADLTGTWTVNGNRVTLSQSADTFLRNMPLRVLGNTLIGDQTFSGTRVQVTLTKQ